MRKHVPNNLMTSQCHKTLNYWGTPQGSLPRSYYIWVSGVGMAMGEAGPKDRIFTLVLHGFVLSHSHFTLHDGENFLVPSLPLRTLPHPVKFYFLLICLTTRTFFFKKIKLISSIKIYLKLQLNLSHQIKLIFSKNWMILSKCFTRQSQKINLII